MRQGAGDRRVDRIPARRRHDAALLPGLPIPGHENRRDVRARDLEAGVGG